MRALAAVFLLAFSASAQDSVGGPPEIGLRAQKARELVDALPAPARVELKKMYRRYKDAVTRKLVSVYNGIIN